MNNYERKEMYESIADLSRFGLRNREFTEVETFQMILDNWNSLRANPIAYYLPYDAIQQLGSIVANVRLMNNASKKYKMIEELLARYGLVHLASGTNRKTFYSKWDPSVIFKIGVDRTGKEANLAEVQSQQILRPYCVRIFQVLPDGLISLQERVDTMTWEDYNHRYAGLIFDIIMGLIYNGFIMEDIGKNFFRNWGIRSTNRIPVLLDFPYVYKIDWSKLRCIHTDPLTGIQCDGYLDYDYRGMNEIICTKCGTRYSAAYLAKVGTPEEYNPNKIEQRRDSTMPLLNLNNIKVQLMKGDQVVHRYYNETEAEKEIRPTRRYQPNVKVIGDVVEGEQRKFESNPTKKVKYNKHLKRDIIDFLKHVSGEYSPNTAVEIAERLGIKFYAYDNNPNTTKPASNLNENKKEEDNPQQAPQQQYKKVGVEEYKKDKEERIENDPNNKLRKKLESLNKYNMDGTDDYCNSVWDGKTVIYDEESGLYSFPKELLDHDFDDIRNVNRLLAFFDAIDNDARRRRGIEPRYHVDPKFGDPKMVEKPMSSPPFIRQYTDPVYQTKANMAVQTYKDVVEIANKKRQEESIAIQQQVEQQEPNQIKNIITETLTQEELEKATSNDKQKDGLFPVKPMTQKEIEEMLMGESQENVVHGIPGEPLVDTMIFERAIPGIKVGIENLFSFKFDDDGLEPEEAVDKLTKETEKCCKDLIKPLLRGETNGIKSQVTKTSDERNFDCYNVSLTNNGSPLLEVRIYPKKYSPFNEVKKEEEPISKGQEEILLPIKIAFNPEGETMSNKSIEQFLKEASSKLDLNNYYDEEEAKRSIINNLCAGIKDNFKDTPYATANELAKTFVEEHFKFGESVEMSKVEDEL